MDHAPESKFQEPTDNRTRAGLGKFLRPNTPYDNFMEAQGIPIYRDIGVHRVQDLPRKPWKRMGGSGTFIQLLGTEGSLGLLCRRGSRRGRVKCRKTYVRRAIPRRRWPRDDRSLG